MPASLPGSTEVQNKANPSLGPWVSFDPISGAKGSPFDVRRISAWGATTGTPTYVNDAANQYCSTGALSTGIGMGANHVINTSGIFAAGFDDNIIPGEIPTYAAPPPPGVVSANTIGSTRMYIGGGRQVTSGAPQYLNVAGQAGCSPYTAGIALAGAGNGASRDAGAGPAFTAFPMKMVTATGSTANGADIEVGFANRSNVTMTTGQSAFGSAGAALAAPS